MYATSVVREMDAATRAMTLERAANEFWPQLRAAAGFRHFYLIQQSDSQILGIILWDTWDTAEQAAAFAAVTDGWQATMDNLGHRRIVSGGGDVLEIAKG